jgi:hypothetical protein
MVISLARALSRVWRLNSFLLFHIDRGLFHERRPERHTRRPPASAEAHGITCGFTYGGDTDNCEDDGAFGEGELERSERPK